jgi:hypothetical protein
MAVDTAAKRSSALAGLNHPYLRLAVPDGSVDRAASLGLYNGFAGDTPASSDGGNGFINFNDFTIGFLP